MRYPTQDPKYSIEVNEGGAFLVNAVTGIAIPADEPIFIFRAKDKRALNALWGYIDHCTNMDHIRAVEQRIDEFENFSDTHQHRMKEPDTAAVPKSGTTQQRAQGPEVHGSNENAVSDYNLSGEGR